MYIYLRMLVVMLAVAEPFIFSRSTKIPQNFHDNNKHTRWRHRRKKHRTTIRFFFSIFLREISYVLREANVSRTLPD